MSSKQIAFGGVVAIPSQQVFTERQRLAAPSQPDEDLLLYQPLCPQCRAQITWHGKQPAPEQATYWVV